MRIRPARSTDGPELAEIYNHYIRQTVVTFDEEPVSGANLSRRIEEVLAIPLPWLVADEAGALVGYAYASPWKSRPAYRFSVESTVYVAPGQGRRGIGSRLIEHLLAALRRHGVHSVLGGIALPNPASVALHERFGFLPAGQLREVGFKHGRWIDVGYWQRTFGPASRPTEEP